MCIIQLESTYRSYKIGQVLESNSPSIYLALSYSLNPTPTRKVPENIIGASKYEIIMVLWNCSFSNISIAMVAALFNSKGDSEK